MLCLAVASCLGTTVVDTTLGKVAAETRGDVSFFPSIPFAAPPTSHNRFRPPQPGIPWKGVLSPYTPNRQCPQMGVLGDEDCLLLHVAVPHECTPSKPCSVLFWIYGGAFVIGSDEEFGFYDPVELASTQRVVVVASNYRLGALGFLAHPALARESNGTVGNWGTLDQQAALKWTRANIAQFGGDKDAVTISGESAGAMSVCWHMGAPGSKGLFHRAIVESGNCAVPAFFMSLHDALSYGNARAAEVGCDAAKLRTDTALLACLRALPPHKFHSSPPPPGGESADAEAVTDPRTLRESVRRTLGRLLLQLEEDRGGSTVLGGDGQGSEAAAAAAASRDATVTALARSVERSFPHLLPQLASASLTPPASLASPPTTTTVSSPPTTTSSPHPPSHAVPPFAPIMSWGPVVDGVAHGLPETPLHALSHGRGNPVPTIVGTNHDEGSLFVLLYPLLVPGASLPPRPADLRKMILKVFGGPWANATAASAAKVAAALQTFYPSAEYPSEFWRNAALIRDYVFACPSRRLARALDSSRATLTRPTPVWTYHFAPKYCQQPDRCAPARRPPTHHLPPISRVCMPLCVTYDLPRMHAHVHVLPCDLPHACMSMTNS